MTSAEESGVANSRQPSVDELKSDIRLLVHMAKEPSFSEMMAIKGFAGTETIFAGSGAFVLWDRISPEAICALAELIEDGEINAVICHPAVYLHCDYAPPMLPVAAGEGPFDSPHWRPVLFKIGRPIWQGNPLLN